MNFLKEWHVSDLQRYTWILYLFTDVEDIVVFLAWEVRDFYIFLFAIRMKEKTQVIFVTKPLQKILAHIKLIRSW